MNYGRHRNELDAFIKGKIKEKMSVLRTMPSDKRNQAEQLIIKLAKEEYMGYKNGKQQNGSKDVAEVAKNEESVQVDSADEAAQDSESVDGELESSDSESSEEVQSGSDDKPRSNNQRRRRK